MRTSAAAIGVAGAVALGSIAGGVFAQPTSDQVIGTGTIVTAGQVGANCRAEPNINAQFLTLVPDGQIVQVTGAAENDFLPVICNDQNGWIYAPLVTNIIPATPVATPGTAVATPGTAVASPAAAAVPAWVATYAVNPAVEITGDSVTVGVKLGEALEINAPAFEARPFVTLQTTNESTSDATFVLFSAPEGTDATGFTIPAEESALPSGVTPVASYEVKAGETTGAVLQDLPAGTYILATTTGQALSFTVDPEAEIEVPDIFASPVATEAPAEAATPEATPAPATPAAAAVPAWIASYAIDPAVQVTGDSVAVGVKAGEALEINAPSFETRPFVTLQTTNETDEDLTFVLFTAPEGTDATGFAIPEDEAALPEGVTPYASYEVKAGETTGAVLQDLPAGTYILADISGQALSFTVQPEAAIDVPDIFASPTTAPTEEPTATTEPTATEEPTATTEPTATEVPTEEPTATEVPTEEPTATEAPTEEPTATEAPATPVATPAPAVPAWIASYAIDPAVQVTGDSVAVGVKAGEALEINAPSFEARPFVTLQTTNETDEDLTFVLFSAPEGTDATGFTIPAEESALPEGVSPVASYEVKAGETVGAVLPDLQPGTYILADTSGQALSFTVQPETAIDVPDIFASPSATDEVPATPAASATAVETGSASPAASPASAGPAWVATYAIDPKATAEGDTATVGVKVGDTLEINAPAFETRPSVILQTTNDTKKDVTLVLFSVPEGTEATGFTVPASESDLPAGVKAYAGYEVKAGETFGAVLKDLPAGTYILATTDGQAVAFTVQPEAAIDVPDIFATPEGTPRG
jgi:uncharacterized protein involved in tellurium resistance